VLDKVCVSVSIKSQSVMSLSFCILKNVPSEPSGNGEDQPDAPTQEAVIPKEEDFKLEEEIIDVSYCLAAY